MFLACGHDGEPAAILAVLHLDVLALLDLGAESGTGAGDLGQEGEGSDLHSPPLGKAVDRLYGAPSCLDPGLPLWPLLFCVQSQASLRGSSSGVSGKRAEHGPTDGLCLPLLPNPEPGRVP